MDQVYQPTEVLTVLPQPHISAAQFAEYLRIEYDTQDKPELEGMLDAAFSFLESEIDADIRLKNRRLRLPECGLSRSQFGGNTEKVVRLYDGPVVDIESLTYTDSQGSTQTYNAADYTLYNHLTPAELHLRNIPNDISSDDPLPFTLIFNTGKNVIDAQTRQGVLLIAADMYENRTSETNLNIKILPAFQRLVEHLKRYLR